MAKHFAREGEVPAGIDQHRLPSTIDEAKIGLPPTSVRDHPRVGLPGDLIKPLLEGYRGAHARGRPACTDEKARSDHDLTIVVRSGPCGHHNVRLPSRTLRDRGHRGAAESCQDRT